MWNVRWFAGLLVVGLLSIAIYYILDGLDIGGIGSTSDIGGGLLLLLGYALSAAGIIGGAVVWTNRKRRTIK